MKSCFAFFFVKNYEKRTHMKSYNWTLVFGVIFIVLSCETAKVAQKPTIIISDNLIVNMLDSTLASDLRYEGKEDGIFDRKIIYRDMRAAKPATPERGRVSLKVCVDQDGIVKYAEVQRDSTNITNLKTLKNYLRSSLGYKFQPDYEAPKYQCGKLSFKLDYTLHNAKRR